MEEEALEKALEIIQDWKIVWSRGAELDYLEYPPQEPKINQEPEVQTIMAVPLKCMREIWTPEALIKATTRLNQPLPGPPRPDDNDDWLRRDTRQKLEIHKNWTNAFIQASLTNTYTEKVVEVASCEIFDSSLGLCLITTSDGEKYYFGRGHPNYTASLDCLRRRQGKVLLTMAGDEFVVSAEFNT